MSSSNTETTLVDVMMPQMGVSVVEGTVVEWKKQAGDWVQADEIIASISTDKIDTDVEAPATGRVQEVIVEVGATVEVGTVLVARPAELCTDNGAMIAWAGAERLALGLTDTLDAVPHARWPLADVKSKYVPPAAGTAKRD